MVLRVFAKRIRGAVALGAAVVFVAAFSALLLAALALMLSKLSAGYVAHPALAWFLPVVGVCTYGLYRFLQVPFFLTDAEVIYKVTSRIIPLDVEPSAKDNLFAEALTSKPGVQSAAGEFVMPITPSGSVISESRIQGQIPREPILPQKPLSPREAQVDERIRKAPLLPSHFCIAILFATVLTVAFGGSVGGESAAFQVGSAMALCAAVPWLFKRLAPDAQQKIDTMLLARCGMASALAALFVTPLTSALFIGEMSSWLNDACSRKAKAKAFCAMYISALIGTFVGKLMRGENLGWQFQTLELPGVTTDTFIFWAIKLLALFLLVLGAALLWYHALSWGRKATHAFAFHSGVQARCPIPPEVILLVIVGLLSAGLIFVVQPYVGCAETGTGSSPMALVLQGELLGSDWQTLGVGFAKVVLTALLLSGFYKGGDLTPTMAIGAVIGGGFASLLGLPVALGALAGISTFLPVCTNCVLAAMAFGFESFGLLGFLASIPFATVSYLLTKPISFYRNV